MSRIPSRIGVREPGASEDSSERSLRDQPPRDDQGRRGSMLQQVSAAIARVETSARQQYALLAAITLLAALLRFYQLGEWSFWIDEVFTVNSARAIADWALIRLPIGAVLINGALDLFGISEWSARLVPALLGIISVPVLFVFVKRLFNPGIALLASLFLAVSPWHVMWSQNARYFTLLMLLYMVAMFYFMLGMKENRRAYFVVSLLLLLIAIRERSLAAFLVPVVVSYLLLIKTVSFPNPAGLSRKNLAPVLLLAVAVVLLDAISFLVTRDSVLVRAIPAFIEAFVGQPIDDPVRLVILIVFSIGVPLTALGLFAGGYLVSLKSEQGLFLLVSAVLPVLLLAAVNPFVFTVERYAFVTLPSWVILGAIGVRDLLARSREHARILAAAVLFMVLADAASAHLMYYQINSGNRPDWRGAFALVEQRKGEGDLVVSTWPEIGDYYLKQDVLRLRDLDPESLARQEKRAWFVIDSEAVWFADGSIKSWVEEQSELIDVRYLRVRENINLRVYLYDPARRAIQR